MGMKRPDSGNRGERVETGEKKRKNTRAGWKGEEKRRGRGKEYDELGKGGREH